MTEVWAVDQLLFSMVQSEHILTSMEGVVHKILVVEVVRGTDQKIPGQEQPRDLSHDTMAEVEVTNEEHPQEEEVGVEGN